jgi:hypothetical protein
MPPALDILLRIVKLCFCMYSWLTFLFLCRILLEFWKGLCWKYRLLLVVWPFSQCWFYLSRSMEDLSIFWCLLQFLSSVVYSFHQKVLLFLLLNLFQGTFFFEATVNGIVSLISFSVCVLLVYRKATDSSIVILYACYFAGFNEWVW